MTRFVLFFFAFVALGCVTAHKERSYSDPQQDEDDAQERQLIRRITQTRTIIPGGGLYGGYAGGMGYPGMYDEDQSQSENQDETHDQGFADRIPVLIVPHHAVQRFLRRQGIDLDQSRRPAEMTQQIDNDLSNNQSAETREVVLQLPNRVIAKLLRKYGRGAC